MSFTAAMEESYASGDEEGVVLTTAEIDHPSFDAPIRVVRGLDVAGDPDATIPLPIEAGGQALPHTPCDFSLTRPGADHDGPTEGKVTIDNVSGLLHPYLKAAAGYGEPITITFRQYRVVDRLEDVMRPDEDIPGLQLANVRLTAAAAEGTVSWPDGRKLNVPTGPNAFFDRQSYPALFS